MLYKKNASPSLDDALFRKPTSEYRGTPFWAWNCALEKDELLRQIEIFKQMGLGGFHMHVRTGLATPYLSDEYMQDIKACVDKAKDEQMLAWLYDEDRWPSGAAGGLVTKDERYRARYLLFTHTPYSGNVEKIDDSSARAVRNECGTFLACYDVVLDADGSLAEYRQIDASAPVKGEKWYAYLEVHTPSPWYNNQSYVNTLDKASIDRFIEVTHEKYKAWVSGDFGETVPAIFTDEPQFTHKSVLPNAHDKRDVVLPWTDDLTDSFYAAYGEDLLAGVPELVWDLPHNGVSVIRYHYHDHVAERFAQAFADNCGQWCRDNGLMLTGHMMEEPTLKSQTAALGEAMRSYRGFDLPGIDMLCASFELTTAKQAQSAAHQFGREGVLSELYGVTGWDFDFRGHKLHGDWQAALGVTVRVPHLSWVSMAGEAKRDYPASINYQSPWYKEYAYVEDHFARVNAAMTRGVPVVKIGVIHPVESYWLHWGPNDRSALLRAQLDDNFKNLTDWLLKGSIDFDFISESLLPSLCDKGSAPLKVGKMAYDAVIVPACETLRSTTLERLEQFAADGGKLIFMGDAPTCENAVLSDRGAALCKKARQIPYMRASILAELEENRLLSILYENGVTAGEFIHGLRQDSDGLWLFVSHACEPYNKHLSDDETLKITFKGIYYPVIYNTLNGEIYAAEYNHVNGATVITQTLYDYDSLLVKYCLEPQGCRQPDAAAQMSVDKGISVPSEVPFTADEPNVLLLDTAEFHLDDDDFSPVEELLIADNICRDKLGWPSRKDSVAQPWVIENEPTAHTITLKFDIESEIDYIGAKLALEDAEKAVITFNGHSVSPDIDGWYVDKSIKTLPLPAVKTGINTLIVTLPFGKRTDVEWCYLLGDFGVRVAGRKKVITAMPTTLCFGDIVSQGFPFYGGNITYHVPFKTDGGSVTVKLKQYEGAATKLFIDGKDAGYVVYPPYTLTTESLSAGKHTLDIKLFTHRANAFGAVHLANHKCSWLGPDSWRSEDDEWGYEYFLKRVGVIITPEIYKD